MTTRLSMRSLAGMARTLVAVGTLRLASMLVTVRAAAPRNGCTSSSVSGPVGLTGGMSRGLGAVLAAGFLAGDGGLGFHAPQGRWCTVAAALALGAIAGLVVGEELPPGRVHRVLVCQIL